MNWRDYAASATDAVRVALNFALQYAAIAAVIARIALKFALQSAAAAVIFLFIALLTRILYNIFLHPLRSYPGPRLWAATRLPWIRQSITGHIAFTLKDMHDKYGPVMRIAPNELSYNTAAVWKQIYSHRPRGEMPKDLQGSGIIVGAGRAPSIINADREDHARFRRLISHAFSERALREQEGFLQLYIDKLMNGLRKVAGEGPQNMVKWYTWTTFDVIGDMAYGESFGMLENTAEDPWVHEIMSAIRVVPYIQALVYYRLLPLSKYFIPKSLNEKRQLMARKSVDKVDRRLAKSEDRKDFLSYILRANDDKGMSTAELHSTSTVLIIGGSETTATLLSGVTYCLLSNRDKYDKLIEEVRGRFTKESDITIQAVGELKYMLAVLDEALRFYPPVPGSLTRVVPGKGELLDGRWVPGGTTVGIHQFSTYRSATNFHAPDAFVPERWLLEATTDPSSPYFNDNRAACQPFSYGPRNCIGKNLAYAEMRLILARLLWNFDLALVPGPTAERWIERQHIYMMWDKVPLMVELKPLVR